jgi:hypothetical protein
MLLEPELGVCVEILPRGGQLGMERVDAIERFHAILVARMKRNAIRVPAFAEFILGRAEGATRGLHAGYKRGTPCSLRIEAYTWP